MVERSIRSQRHLLRALVKFVLCVHRLNDSDLIIRFTLMVEQFQILNRIERRQVVFLTRQQLFPVFVSHDYESLLRQTNSYVMLI